VDCNKLVFCGCLVNTFGAAILNLLVSTIYTHKKRGTEVPLLVSLLLVT